MRSDFSRHTWHYLEDDEAAKEWPLSLADKYYLNIPLVTLLASHPGPPD
jgi:lanosterol synthase